MDNGYLNNAVYQMEEFLARAVPSSESELIYGERREHCFTGDTEHPNNVGSRTVHQRYMPAMAQWMIKTAPAGADTKSWVHRRSRHDVESVPIDRAQPAGGGGAFAHEPSRLPRRRKDLRDPRLSGGGMGDGEAHAGPAAAVYDCASRRVSAHQGRVGTARRDERSAARGRRASRASGAGRRVAE